MITEIKLLDHGYVKFIESWGSDERIIESARMSTDKGFLGWGPVHDITCECSGVNELKAPCHCIPKPGDEKLLRYLYTHKHMTPFEMAGMTIEAQAPIFVFREWHRHRTQSYNELSARYTPLPDLFYTPSLQRLMNARQDTKNKQGSTVGFGEDVADLIASKMEGVYYNARAVYEQLLEIGVAREIARLVIPVAQYSRMRASANLRNWLVFLTLRMDTAAQWEIRQYAGAVGEIVKELWPRTWELFLETKTG